MMRMGGGTLLTIIVFIGRKENLGRKKKRRKGRLNKNERLLVFIIIINCVIFVCKL